MPTVSKTSPVRYAQTYDAKVFDWGKRLWSAVKKEGKYSKAHEGFFKDYVKLRDEAQALKPRTPTNLTMFDYVAPVYNHVDSQGYTAQIHYQPLREAVSNYCEGKPVPSWTPPPGQLSRPPSQELLSPSPGSRRRRKEGLPRMIPSNAPNADGKKKKGKKKKGELVKLQKAKVKLPTSEGVEAKSLPAADGMATSLIKCTLCEKRGRVCHVNPKATKKATAACFECNHCSLKCSLSSSRAKKSEALAEQNDEEIAASKDQAPKQRKSLRLTQRDVPARQPGQFNAESLAPEILTKLDSLESGQSQLLERMSQSIACLTAENRSTREMLQLLLETSRRDEAMGEDMKSTILDHAEKIDGLRETGEALLKVLDAVANQTPPIPTPLALPSATLPAATLKSSPTPTTLTEFPPNGVRSNKRPGDEHYEPESNKRRKVGKS